MVDVNTCDAVTVKCGCSVRKESFYLSSRVDCIFEEDEDLCYSRVFTCRLDIPKWGHHNLEGWDVVSVCKRKEHALNGIVVCALSKDGDVEYGGKTGFSTEHIPTAGLGNEDTEGHGYVTRIREIGEHLYVCGSFGQIYKRISSEWIHIDEPFLQKPRSGVPEGKKLVDVLTEEIDTALMFEDINGTGEQDIYVCGMNGLLVHWNGERWRTLKKLTDAHFNEIHVVSKDEVWICGTKGVVLKGNAREGFRTIIADRNGKQFTSIHVFKGKVYLADYERLYTLEADEETGQLEAKPIIPMFGLSPGLQDAHMLDSAEGVLWSFGTKDLAFTEDGNRWTRVDHPDNPKIG